MNSGYKGDNPNANPICNKGIHATCKPLARDVLCCRSPFFVAVADQGNTVYVIVTDRCEGCAFYDLDFTDDGFNSLTQGKGDGRENFSWSWA